MVAGTERHSAVDPQHPTCIHHQLACRQVGSANQCCFNPLHAGQRAEWMLSGQHGQPTTSRNARGRSAGWGLCGSCGRLAGSWCVVVLCCAVLCCTVVCCAVLCCAVLCSPCSYCSERQRVTCLDLTHGRPTPCNTSLCLVQQREARGLSGSGDPALDGLPEDFEATAQEDEEPESLREARQRLAAFTASRAPQDNQLQGVGGGLCRVYCREL
jgi:hypothetical protein